MKAVIAIILAFAITANCGLLKTPSGSAPMLSLVEIDQHPLGKSLLSLMSLHMKAQGPLQDLPILLQQIHDDLEVQDEQNEQKHIRDEQYCDETVTSLKKSIEEHGGQFALQQHINKEAKAALARNQQTLEEVVAQIAKNEKRTEEGTAQRAQQHELYVSDLADNVDAIDACKQAIQLLNALRSGTSFVQLKTKFQKVAERLQATKTSKHTHIYTPIIKALAQITSKADQEIIGRILDLLNNLLTQLQQAKATIEETETKQAAYWAKELEDLTLEHARLVQKKAETEENIETAEETIEDSDAQMKHHLQAAENAARTLDATLSECQAKRENYERVRDELSREISIVEQLQRHFNEKLAGLQEYVDNAPAAF